MIDFRYPAALYLYLPILILWLGWYWRYRNRKSVFLNISPALEANLFNRLSVSNRIWKRRLGSIGLIILVFAASGPQIGKHLKPVERKGVDLVFALDVSSSMEAEDVKPSRLAKAKFEISQMIRELAGDRVGLIVFAGTSNLYLPLTSDYEAAQLFLDAVDTKMIPTQGTDLSTALNTALSAFPDETEKYRVLVLISDGEDHQGEAIKVAEGAAKSGIIVHTIGVGTVTGSLIPIDNGEGKRSEYKRDLQGHLITSSLNERILEDIAQAGDGKYMRFDNRYANYQLLLAEINSMEKRTIKTHEYAQFEDRYQLFSFFALLFFLAAFLMPTRRKSDETWRGRIV